ncbi:MAG: AAA family ATPase [Oscillospiraceae bacterium]|nr:MAG: AAA family ATPase [Oscillospiraceae bacterium]
MAVIRQADIDFTEGLCVLTGETGAGKSLLIDSLNALTGGRVSRDLIRAGEENAMISALFDGLDEPTRAALSELGVELPEDGTGSCSSARSAATASRSRGSAGVP